MKKLIIINGNMAVGKSSICKVLYKKMDKSIWLDADWCWMMNPICFTDENINMIESNTLFLLRNYLNNTFYQNVIFSWVIDKEVVFKRFLSKLKDIDYKLVIVTITCLEEELKKRLRQRGIEDEIFLDSIINSNLYDEMKSKKIDNTYNSIEESVNKVLDAIN
ncbi:MAG: hypothetical protein A2504_01975 [Bdellovibrionales bacterium RIFOXYD12_FULL_39_22]|nr:MAG: hypothetical protein A2385_12000 [Bdellovibrionales bacterium RIFOXYB1_FULL_39_21]OFZ41366.1 MAG: hypothetical protein A2485_01170 [Bdellovibrionales bacterium RIFOXYC12_FULL_39_17]OFZ45320.1 MAG: hypothetical protein A2404_13185 [Bdellovibrionales bacterium RIFOXYC1_FULL_39_130]OFZ74516.1 MAG: hypothetical protein A2560_12290 [Bdellovibrionales bacterium RIFOXYD1_FULL_39_84]OFZ92526.1 MAG: hypothetical protein A2504_01975 [Bdellovibrionales bacterium RIFOXYD12_FULL_39_22]HLE09740.1 AA